jgi:hypothetical protein
MAPIYLRVDHVSTGVKIVDKRGVHSVTKQPFMINDVDNDQIDFIKVQSLELCCIMMIADAVDNKEL